MINNLPFSLTVDQLKAVDEIYQDLTNPRRMNRLLQGDVGSGKTIVAFIAMYMNYLAGYQSAMMAPTEILAIQHYNNIKKIFPDLNIDILLGSTKTVCIHLFSPKKVLTVLSTLSISVSSNKHSSL